jgi:hypothetical protein
VFGMVGWGSFFRSLYCVRLSSFILAVYPFLFRLFLRV